MKIKSTVLAAGLALGMISLPGAAIAGDDIAVSSLPPEVSKALAEHFPKAEVIKAEKDTTDDGKLKYEVKVRDEGQLKEAHISPEGKLLKVDKED